MLSYLNGVLVDTTQLQNKFLEPTDYQYFIGAQWDGNPEFTGEIGEVRLYSGAISATEVTNIYSSTVANYTNTPIPTEMKIRLTASTYSGSGAWINTGTLGTTHNATVHTGTPSKNTTGNGIIFNRNLAFKFPTIGMMTQYTQSIWFRRTGISGTLLTQQSHWSANIGPYITHNNGRLFYGRFRTAGQDFGGGGIDTDLNTWYHLTIVYNGSQIISYINGNIVDLANTSGRYVETTDSQYFIGANWDGGAEFTGHIGEVRIYNGALSTSEIQGIYNATYSLYHTLATPVQTTATMRILLNASSYSGSGAWTNTGTLGTTHNATIHTGTPVKNTAGNGIIFNGGLVFKFPNIGTLTTYTQSIWLKRTGLSRTIMTQQNNNSGNWTAMINANNGRHFYGQYVRNGGWYNGGWIETDVDTWYNLTIVWTGTQMLSYLNGVLQNITTISVTPLDNGWQYFIGGNWEGGASFIGEIGEVRLYSGVLGAAAVAEIYNTTVTTYPNPPPPATEMKVRYTATNYSGTGDWVNTGTLGTTHNATIHSGTPSKSGNGVVFNGGLVFKFPNIGSLPRYTQSVWFKRTGLSRTIMAQHHNGSGNITAIIDANNGRHYYSRLYYNSSWYGGGWIETDVDTWYNLTIVWTGSQMLSYLNGSIVNIVTVNGAYSEQNGLQYFIGGQWDGGAQFIGEIGEVRLYNGVLDASAVAEIYNTTVATYPNSSPATEMKVRYTATNYSGTGDWVNTGTLGTTHNATIHSGTPSKSGNGVVFNGGLVFKFPNIGSLPRYTQSVWFRRTGNANTIMTQHHNGSGNITAIIQGNGSNGFYGNMYYNSSWYSGNTISANLNTWYNLTITWDGNIMRTYLNGAFQGRITMNGGYSEQNGLQYFIGGQWDGGATFIGHIGEIRLYNGVISDADITSIYTNGSTIYV